MKRNDTIKVEIFIPLEKKNNRIKVTTNFNDENFRVVVPKDSPLKIVPTLYKASKLVQTIFQNSSSVNRTNP